MRRSETGIVDQVLFALSVASFFSLKKKSFSLLIEVPFTNVVQEEHCNFPTQCRVQITVEFTVSDGVLKSWGFRIMVWASKVTVSTLKCHEIALTREISFRRLTGFLKFDSMCWQHPYNFCFDFLSALKCHEIALTREISFRRLTGFLKFDSMCWQHPYNFCFDLRSPNFFKSTIHSYILCLNKTCSFNHACMLLCALKLWIFYACRYCFLVCNSCVAPTFSFEWNKEVLGLNGLMYLTKHADSNRTLNFLLDPVRWCWPSTTRATSSARSECARWRHLRLETSLPVATVRREHVASCTGRRWGFR